MEAGKGHNNLLDTLALLKSVPDWHCWIVGGAQRAEEISYAGQLKSKAAELGLSERVLFLGERKDVRQLMAASDFYFQPNSGPEGFSIVFMEALLSELPIITSDMGGAPELIDDSCGFLIKPSDLNAFAAAVEALIVDPQLCASLGRAGREKVHALCDTARQLERFKDLCIKYSAETNS
jgi:glycosyltransferase involved in cell wall biosynthesis